MAVTQGYRKTEIGVLPVTWEVRSLGDLGSVSSGGTPSRDNPSYWGGGIPWITTTQIDFNTIHVADEYITAHGLQRSAARIYPVGTLLMAMYGQGKTRGKIAILGIKAATNQACAAIALNGGASTDYVFHYLASRYEQIRKLSNSGGQENLSGMIVRTIPIPVPPKSEQVAIATALSDVDALLLKLDQLMAKKRDLKQGAMQELLTGNRRLPAFDGKWQQTRLGSIGTFSKGSGIKKDQVLDQGIPCVRYGELYTHHNDYIRELFSFISPEIARQSQLLRRGDLLFAGSGETTEEIGKCVAFLGSEDVYAGGDIVIFSPRGQDSMYLGYLMNHPAVVAQKARMGQGDAVVHISARNLAAIEITIPEHAEQIAIASVLRDMDADIAALEARRAKTHAIKQGMMQELLTGRIRLV